MLSSLSSLLSCQPASCQCGTGKCRACFDSSMAGTRERPPAENASSRCQSLMSILAVVNRSGFEADSLGEEDADDDDAHASTYDSAPCGRTAVTNPLARLTSGS